MQCWHSWHMGLPLNFVNAYMFWRVDLNFFLESFHFSWSWHYFLVPYHLLLNIHSTVICANIISAMNSLCSCSWSIVPKTMILIDDWIYLFTSEVFGGSESNKVLYKHLLLHNIKKKLFASTKLSKQWCNRLTQCHDRKEIIQNFYNTH